VLNNDVSPADIIKIEMDRLEQKLEQGIEIKIRQPLRFHNRVSWADNADLSADIKAASDLLLPKVSLAK
jgi:hypothetical protein